MKISLFNNMGRRRVEQDLNWNRQIAPLLAAYRNALSKDNVASTLGEAGPQLEHV